MTSINKMKEMPIRKLLLSMSLPIMVSMLIQALYNIVDSMFVAQYSQDALAAVSLAFPIQTLIVAVSVGTAAGLNSLLSRKLGEQNFKEANEVANHGVLAALLSGIPFMIFGIFFAQTFISAFSDRSTIISDGTTYTLICTVCSSAVLVEIAYERLFQATGHAMYNMYMQGAGALINIILDPIFIFGWFGFPAMGVTGAALATVTGQILAVLLGIYLQRRHVKELHISFRGFHLKKHIFAQMYAVGFPSIIMQSIVTVLTIGMNAILVGFSETAVSVFSVYFKLQNFVFMAVFGMNNALVAIIGYNFGARQKERILSSIRFAIQMAVLIMLIGTLIFQLFPQALLQLFNADAAMLKIGVPALRIISLSFLFAGISIELSALFQALGKGVSSLMISLCRQLLIVLPCAYLLARFSELDSIWYAFLIAEAFAMVIALFLYRKIKISMIDPMEHSL
ncbi:MATE family efflux transporter [Massilicoli timonensis]|uniref:MATE family efflux transporter n=1 Tax=Massilicoli timonensis TaxID=2015901 RepID=UPI003AAB9AFB